MTTHRTYPYTYYALTTQNAELLGWRIVASGSNAGQVFEQALATLGPIQANDIYGQTDHRNLVVVSKTEAKRRYGVGGTAGDAELEGGAEVPDPPDPPEQ